MIIVYNGHVWFYYINNMIQMDLTGFTKTVDLSVSLSEQKYFRKVRI